jgi:RsiW-degrading membrane proteinase PrsW (M82 family)
MSVVALPSDQLPSEWWERVAAGLNEALFGRAGTQRVMGVVLLGLGVASIVTVVTNDDLLEGAKVWLACVLMLVGWTLLMVTRTVRLTSVLRLFSAAMVWSVVIAWLSVRWSTRGFLTESSAGPGIAIAGLVEETFKLLPLALLAVVAPGRVRRFTVADWLCCGLALGMGFQAAEDFVRQATYEPGLFDLLEGRPWKYGWTLFGGTFDYNETQFAGHHITTALAAAGIGFAVVASMRRRRWWPVVWLVPLAFWVLVVCDHLAFNATVQNPAYRDSVVSPIPQFVHSVWSATGYGFNRGWLLAGFALVAAAAFPPASRWERVVRAVAERLVAAVRDVLQRWWGALGALATAPTGRVSSMLAAVEACQLGREQRASGDSVGGRRVTRWVSVVVGVAAGVVSVQLAIVLAQRIGGVLDARGERSWFADLLEALLDMWDDLGPGGQIGLLALGVTMMLLPGSIIVLGGWSVAGVGVVGATTVVVPAAVGTAGAVIAGTSIGLAMADAAQPGAGRNRDDGGSDDGAARRQERLEELSRDPDHGGSPNPKSKHEAEVGLRLEEDGQLKGPIRRDPSGNAEFIDGASQQWDVKGFHSGYENRYDFDVAMTAIERELATGENVVLDTTYLSPQHVDELMAGVQSRSDWVGRIVWYRP